MSTTRYATIPADPARGPRGMVHDGDASFGPAGLGGTDRSEPGPDRARPVRSWPLLLLAAPAAVAVWSGWVGIGRMTGFGQVHPLPGIWDSLHIDSAITLPIGVEAYGAYALRAWLSASPSVSAVARRFARWSAIGSLLLGMCGQVSYHLLSQAGAARAPWGITMAVSCLPVLVLGMGVALAHLLRADAHCQDGAGGPAWSAGPDRRTDQAGIRSLSVDQVRGTVRPDRLAEATSLAIRLTTAGQRISRRSLRAAGIRGSNAELGSLARIAAAEVAVRCAGK